MSDYISRDAAYKFMFDIPNPNGPGEIEVVSVEDIESIPAADVVPVRHAYWRHYDTTIGGTKLYVCSLCDGDSKTENEIKRCAYCPNCGALMDKEGDGE